MPPASSFGRLASICAQNRIRAIFITSEGWIWSGPAASQAREPLTSTPTPGTITTTQRKKAPIRISGVIGRSALTPRRANRCMTTSPIAPKISVRFR